MDWAIPMSGIAERYGEDGIWTMKTPRESCVVPNTPLMITQQQEWALNKLALSTWGALSNVVELAENSKLEPWNRLGRLSQNYPEGLTLPPAIRIDTIMTEFGPKIIEVDPISAISLGETASLISIWQEQGYQVPYGFIDTIASSISEKGGALAISIPPEKKLYEAELSYLGKELERRGVLISDTASLQLSAFSDVPSRRKALNSRPWASPQNPLWGSLTDFGDKNNLSLLTAGDKEVFTSFLARNYTREEVMALDGDTRLVVKPVKGTGSMAVTSQLAKNIQSMAPGYVFQEQLIPQTDTFGFDNGVTYKSRVSIYAGRYGLLGAQVTARPSKGEFTNVHGQYDAVQTTIAVDLNRSSSYE